jgi:PleD family two-component response regulator
MSDTSPRNPVGASQMLADALLRSMTGTTALLRVTNTNVDTNQSEVGIVATTFADVPISPVVMRKLRPTWKEGAESMWELFVSATGVEQQVNALSLSSAESLFAMTLAVSVGGQDYLVESIAANEAFGQVYLYRLLLRETGQKAL